MSRTRRQKGKDIVYHIMQRGNEKKDIFRGPADKERYLQTIKLQQEKYGFEVYSYCLMDNHVHLLLGDAGADISDVMKGLNVSYVQYFNKKYERCGHLFQGRFKSEIVDTESYFLQASKYIHLNPVTAKMVAHPIDYRWSSFGIYIGQRQDKYQLVNTKTILNILSLDTNAAVFAYNSFVNDVLPHDESYERFLKMDLESEEDRVEKIKEILARQGTREDTIVALKKEAGLSYREIGHYMEGVSASTAYRILQKVKQNETSPCFY
jgi:putative transposase